MEAEDPLSQLADIHLPAAVSFWPPAVGWWVLAALVLAGLVWLARLQYLRWQKGQRLKRAINELNRAYAAYKTAAQNEASANQAGLDLLYAINSLLKRVALVHYPQYEIAALSGTAWLRFLDHSAQSKAFTAGPGAVLAEGEYRPVFKADTQALYQLTRSWIERQYLQKTAQGATTASQPDNTVEVRA